MISVLWLLITDGKHDYNGYHFNQEIVTGLRENSEETPPYFWSGSTFIQILQSPPPEILPSPCDFMVDGFINKPKPTLDSVASRNNNYSDKTFGNLISFDQNTFWIHFLDGICYNRLH